VKADYSLPDSWLWIELGNLVRVMDAGWSPQCENHPRSDPKKWGVLKTTAVQTLAFDCGQHKELPSKFEPRPQNEARLGDILVTRAGPKNRVGISCVVDHIEPRLMISDKLIRFRLRDGLSPSFFALTLNAGITNIAIENAKSGMAVMQMNISQDKLRAVPVPLPPLAEQHRIVAKVDALMALCGRLEASLATASVTRRRLFESLLAEALAPDAERELEAAE
jgi:type I restriction enzyme S subunit